MRTKEKQPHPKSPKDVAEGLSKRGALDRDKVHRESRRAVQAADRLLKEMDDVLKQLARKR